MKLLCADRWKDYELIDAGDYEKLERFGDIYLIRPEQHAIGKKRLSTKEWKQMAHAQFHPSSGQKGKWQQFHQIPESWNISYHELKFKLKLTAFKHVGIFPEQSSNWDYISKTIQSFSVDQPKVLNLFAYTGGASLAAKNSSADVVHVDSIKQVIGWARENMELSGLSDIRWTLEDAIKFVKREVKRGRKYNGIIMDPPTFGLGPKGEKWKLEDRINELVESGIELLDEQNHFFILNTYSPSISSADLETIIKNCSTPKNMESGKLVLKSPSGIQIPMSDYARFRS
jgi:23S rRNA (cytosine1962-C5)-methyltransferase